MSTAAVKVRVFGECRRIAPAELDGHEVVIVDVLRATTTLAHAIAAGARVWPVASVTAARRLARELDGALLCGERRGLPIAGFDASNSPVELSRLALDGRAVVLTTSNGTLAVARAARAHRIYAAALVNAPAVARVLAASRARELSLVCAGRSSGFSIDDLVGAGAVIASLRKLRPSLAFTDGAVAAETLFTLHRARLAAFLRNCESGRYLRSIGAGRDLAACAQLGALDCVPLLTRGAFVNAARRPSGAARRRG
jgi:2-phosphosulfolactate phosphatase